MADIRVLDPRVADMIAAGEVVERPASVVKELMENSIDAGAKSVTVEIQRGGMALIRVTDDGAGISDDQCERAFLRHATSKLRHAEDLAAIGTLGFRGEALAAIASVSRVELFSRTSESSLGTALALEGGSVISHDQAGCPLGTTMVVRDLFFNTPARLKFMKKDSAEAAAVLATVQREALSHPEVSVRYIRDGKRELLTPGDGKLGSVLYAVFGRDLALGFTPVQGKGEDVEVTGYVSMPACCRGTRGYQHFFVNGRQIKSKLLTAALERAYENQKMVGRFPGCVLQLTVRPSMVDVNVHPAKTEVKFLYERNVFDALYYTVTAALEGEKRHPVLEIEKPQGRRTEIPVSPKPAEETVLKPVSGIQQRPMPKPVDIPQKDSIAVRKTSERQIPKISPKQDISHSAEKQEPFHYIVEKYVDNVDKPPHRVDRQVQQVQPAVSEENKQTFPEKKIAEPKQTSMAIPAENWRLAGEVLKTYIIVERGDEVLFIDKHAAHERIQFDRMKKEGWTPMAQALLTPIVFTPAPEEMEILLENLKLLEQFGFACDDFGGGMLAVREIPGDIEQGQVEETLCTIAQDLLLGGTADPMSARDAVMHTMACKAAVKGGQKNSPQELMAVARKVMSGEVKYCPHGRPVAVTLTKAQLEKQFKRT